MYVFVHYGLPYYTAQSIIGVQSLSNYIAVSIVKVIVAKGKRNKVWMKNATMYEDKFA